jgi:hypothetical protein
MKTNHLSNGKRLKILREARDRLARGKSGFICWSISEVMKRTIRDYTRYSENKVSELFPELAKHKPADLSPQIEWGWFGYPGNPENRSRRIEVMDALIGELEEKNLQ